MSRESQDKLAVIFLLVFCLILYFNSLGNAFIFDDEHGIQDNSYIKNPCYIPLFFQGYYTSVPFPRGMFRPLLLLSFSFNYIFSGLRPLGYHLINVLLHFLNGILFYYLFRFLKRDLPFGLSLIVSLLFIAHPINTEAVTYITCRSDLLVTFFVLSALISYAKGCLFLPLFLYVLALLSKETGLVLPFLVFAYDFMRPSASDYTDSKGITQIKHKHIFYIVLIGISLSYWIYRGFIFGSSANILAPLSSPIRSFWSNILTQSAVSLFYLRLFLWPYPLIIHHAFPELSSLFNPLAFFSVLGIVIMIVFIFVLRKKQPLISLGLAWYLICLLPKFYAILNIVAAEHHFYLPSFGIYLILAVLSQNLYLKFRRYFIYIVSGLISICAVLVGFRNYEWRDAFSLWKAAVKVQPRSVFALHNLGSEYLKRGEFSEAERLFKKSLSLSNSIQNQVRGRINLAYMLERQGRLTEAEALLKETERISDKDFSVYQFLGRTYLKMGKEKEAEEAWKKGLVLNPFAAEIQIHLGQLYLHQGKLKEAKNYFQAAIKSNPDSFLAYFGLGQVFEEESDVESAIKAYEKSVRLNPAHIFSHYSLGTLYAQKANRRALWHLKEAVRLSSDFAEAHNNLAVFYASMDPPQLELARQHAQKAAILGYKVEEEFLKMIDLPQAGLHETK